MWSLSWNSCQYLPSVLSETTQRLSSFHGSNIWLVSRELFASALFLSSLWKCQVQGRERRQTETEESCAVLAVLCGVENVCSCGNPGMCPSGDGIMQQALTVLRIVDFLAFADKLDVLVNCNLLEHIEDCWFSPSLKPPLKQWAKSDSWMHSKCLKNISCYSIGWWNIKPTAMQKY